MPGTGSNSTREAIRLTKFAKKAGADAHLMVGPYYNKPTQEGYYRHFAAVAEAVDLPIVPLQHPRPDRVEHPARDDRPARRDCPQLVAVKEATGSLDQASQIAALCDLTILSGDDSLTLPLMSIGGRGVSRWSATSCPQDMKALVTAFDAGNMAEAQRWHRKLFPLCRDMLGVATNPIPLKTAMKLLGRDTGELRLPMTPLDDAGRDRVRKTLVQYGLL